MNFEEKKDLSFGDKSDKRQSIMVSRSFGHKVREYHQLESAAASFATKAATKLRMQDSICSNVTLYLTTKKQGEHVRSVSKSVRLAESTADTGRIIVTTLELLESLYDPEFSYSKVAVTLHSISDRKVWQISLTEPENNREKQVSL